MTVQHIDAFFNGIDGNKLYEQCWMPEDVSSAEAVLIIVHGLAEHSGRYEHVAHFMVDHAIAVGTIDHRSHGKSDGKNSEFNSIDELVEDLDIFVRSIKERLPETPLFMYGHSLGGLIATHYVIKKQPDFKGLILTGPALKIADDISPLLIKISGLLAKIAPHMATIKLDGTAISRDPAVVEKYDSDPLNYRGGIPACTAAAMNQGIQEANARFGEITLPLLVMHGAEDRLADQEGSRAIYAGVSSDDKKIIIVNGMYHELVNEPEKEDIMNEMLEWMEARLG
ncbi:MAG: alpha/beta hydrolase [Anaerolineae bacterium]|jgi:alpha-beta hydrolase superfamily lysophospholipase|nr:alpha/beta hydrolase [Anaerolineae bacterium]